MPSRRDVSLRAYDRDGNRAALWRLKQAFETGLGSTGGAAKAAAYESKLTGDYRREWLAWVDRCTTSRARCVTVAALDDGAEGRADPLVGDVFVLPERLAFVWDAAVVNELYVDPEYRGTGVADDLLEAAIAVAEDQALPLDRLLLDVDPSNERAYAFYERHGFEPWGEVVARPLGED